MDCVNRDGTCQEQVVAVNCPFPEAACELRHARMEAERLARVKSDFLVNMSHEMRTPLNAIIGMTDLCLGTDLDKRQQNYLDKIKIASDCLLHLVNDILDFSKIDAGKLQFENVPFALETLFEQLTGVIAHHAEKQGVELIFDIDPLGKVLLGDPMRLGQILINLGTNAIKFSHGGSVVVSARCTGVDETHVQIHFSVRDEGIGMTQDQIAELFQPFSQADASTTRRYGGTGLGLAICARLVEGMGGKIWAESQSGRGSTFHVMVRLGIYGVERREGIAIFAQRLADKAHQPVLVVDDNPIALRNFVEVVGQLGLQVHSAASTQAAISRVQREGMPNYLLCLIDWKMPDENGIACMRQLRHLYRLSGRKPPPMLLVTTYSHSDEINEVANEIDGLLSKPLNVRHLYVEIANCLGLSQPDSRHHDRRRGRNLGKGLNWQQFTNLDILVAEDIEVNREVIRELLAGVGLVVRVAENGAEALAEVSRKAPDVILMDCHMPVLDGYEATRRLRDNPVTCTLPVIALTANATVDDRNRCMNVGMNGYLAKPVRLEALFAELCRCVTVPGDRETVAGKASVVSSIPGIDVRQALLNTGGNEGFLLKMLDRFINDHAARFGQDFKQACDGQDEEGQLRLAHKLKGVAATLGVLEVARNAENLMTCIKAHDISMRDDLSRRIIRDLEAISHRVQMLKMAGS